MFGPRDARPSSGKLIVDGIKRRVPGWTPGYNNFVDVRDVARGMISAWEIGRRGERYILAGHEMTYGDVMRTIARVAGVPPPRRKIPRLAASLFGKWGDFVEQRGQEPIVNTTQIRYAFTDRARKRRASSPTRSAPSSDSMWADRTDSRSAANASYRAASELPTPSGLASFSLNRSSSSSVSSRMRRAVGGPRRAVAQRWHRAAGMIRTPRAIVSRVARRASRGRKNSGAGP